MAKKVTEGMWLFCLILFFVVISGCTNEQKSVPVDPSVKQDAKHWQQIQKGDFENVKNEIDYWSAQEPGQIGHDHYEQLRVRLEALKGIPKNEIDAYQQKLEDIVLVEEMVYAGQPEIDQKIALENKEDGSKIQCKGKGIVPFSFPPMALEDIAFIEPIGQMIGGHVTPIDHGYYTAKGWKPGTPRDNPTVFKEVMTPADGVVQSVQSMPTEFKSSTFGDYRIVIYHTCSVFTIYIHVNQLSTKLQAIADTGKTVEVKVGEVIGKAPGFDFSVHNEDITLPGFLIQEHYDAEPWKVHTVDMFGYFKEPLRTKLLEKNVRQIEPRGGKIDYDIDGKLVGNWFEENSQWYYGKKQYQRMSGYWTTHLAFAYDGLDPTLVIVSLGNFSNDARQFAVKGNAPDPATVDITDGLVKYELVEFEYITTEGSFWDRMSLVKVSKAQGMNLVMGTVLVQMIEKRKINVEVFPGKKASEVKDFTQNAKVYER